LDDDELLSSDNPVDFALYAGKYASRSKEEIQRFNYLRTLTKLLTERGWSGDEKRDLLLFITRILYLRDKELRTRHWEYCEQLTGEGENMQKSFLVEMAEEKVEQRGIEIGIEKGIEKGKEEMARSLLANGVSPDVIAKSAGLPVEQIRALAN
jgi:predicted transposase/invertase (TIGR01784 family)